MLVLRLIARVQKWFSRRNSSQLPALLQLHHPVVLPVGLVYIPICVFHSLAVKVCHSQLCHCKLVSGAAVGKYNIKKQNKTKHIIFTPYHFRNLLTGSLANRHHIIAEGALVHNVETSRQKERETGIS